MAGSQEEAALNLIQLYANAGRRDDAQRLYDTTLSRSGNAEYVRIAREAVHYAGVNAAEGLYRAGREEEAIAILRPILAATTDDRLREHLQGIISTWEEHTAHEQQAKALRDIIDKAKEGKTKEALALLDALLPQVTDDALRAHLTSMRADLAKLTRDMRYE